jgi:hypothetical protein
MVNLRRLNDEGFKEYIRHCIRNARVLRKGENATTVSAPFNFDDANFTEELIPHVKVEKNIFNQDNPARFNIAKHLGTSQIFENEHIDYDDVMIWGWLSLFYWDNLMNENEWLNRVEHYMPATNQEIADILSKEIKYVKETEFSETILDEDQTIQPYLSYRHNIKGVFDMYMQFGDKCKILLSQSPGSLGDDMEQVAGRKFLRKYDVFMENLYSKYWDPNNKKLTISFSARKYKRVTKKGQKKQLDPKFIGSGVRLIEVTDRAAYSYNLGKINIPGFQNVIGKKEFP